MHHRGLPPLFEKGSHIAQVGLEFRVAKDGLRCLSLLVPLPKRWDYSRTPLCLVDAGLGVEPHGADSLRPPPLRDLYPRATCASPAILLPQSPGSGITGLNQNTHVLGSIWQEPQ